MAPFRSEPADLNLPFRRRPRSLEQTGKTGHNQTMPTGPDDKPTLRRIGRSLPIALLRARETVMGPVREMLAQSDINEQKWRVLRVLDEGGPQEMSEVAKAACLLLPSLTRMSRAMEQEGLILRSTDPADRRKSILTISGSGRQVILDHADASNAIVDRLEQLYGHDKLEQLLNLLEDLRAIELQAEPAAPSGKAR